MRGVHFFKFSRSIFTSACKGERTGLYASYGVLAVLKVDHMWYIR